MYIVLSLYKNLEGGDTCFSRSVSVNLCGSYQRDVIIGSKILEPLEKNVMYLN